MKFKFEATGIGSVPFKDQKKACQIIFDNFKAIPYWPQLPKRSYLENMYVQFSQGLPGLVLDEDNRTIYIDASKSASGIEKVYGKYLDGDIEFFKISEGYALGFYEFLDEVKNHFKDIKFIKGQVTGPVSYALSLTDENKKPILYDNDLFEIITKVLSMKAVWQIRKIKKIFPNVILFIDEPYLVSIGSSFVNINIESAVKKIDELIDSIKKEGSLVGVHCCGNTDWPIILKRDIDILSFDSYNFTKEFFLYSTDIKKFLSRGGTIAWGVVPSSETIDKETEDALSQRLKDSLDILAQKGIGRLELSSVITPSCGVGTLDEERAKKVMEATKLLSDDFLNREK